jgi:16S rRNA (adenine1518-N6/adenine1519-N6)-dimethyltransferase
MLNRFLGSFNIFIPQHIIFTLKNQTITTLTTLLQKHKIHPVKHLGQNFLISQKILNQILDAAELSSQDEIIEIGAGLGILTQELAIHVKKIHALEFDTRIFPLLQKNLSEHKNIKLHNIDVRKFIPSSHKYKLIANIPYYLTSPILRKFFVETKFRPNLTVLLIQKEVAEKICAKKFSVLSLEVRVFGEPEIIAQVSAENFLPQPKVQSAILKIKLHQKPAIPETDIANFFQIIHAGFRAPRKKIISSLAAGLTQPKKNIQKILTTAKIDPNLRPADLTISNWQKILKIIE